MKRFIPFWIFLAGWMFNMPPVALAEIPLTDYNALRNVQVDPSSNGLSIRFTFKKALTDFQGPRFFKRSVQMDFPLMYVDPPKRYFPVEARGITQVYVSQFDRELMRVRLMLDQSHSVTRDHFHYEIQGAQLLVRVTEAVPGRTSSPEPAYDATLDRLLERTVAPVATKTSSRTRSSEVIPNSAPLKKADQAIEAARRKMDVDSSRSEESVSSALSGKGGKEKVVSNKSGWRLKDQEPKKSESSKDGQETQTDSLWGTALTMITTLAFVVGLMFLLFHLFKKYVLKEGGFGGSDKPIRVLSTGFLGPKKSIALVEVAGRVLVLGVANEQISLLSSLDNEEDIQRALNGKNNGKVPEVKRNSPVPDKAKPAQPGDEKPDVYTRQVRPQEAKEFSRQIKEFDKKPGKRSPSMEEVARLIRKQREKVTVGA